MQLNNVVFPAPISTYDISEYNNLIWIPRNPTGNVDKKPPYAYKKIKDKIIKAQILEEDNEVRQNDTYFPSCHPIFSRNKETISKYNENINKKLCQKIPCLFFEYPLGSNKVLIYFHGNAEDNGQAIEFCNQLLINLKVHVLSIEYPGYGIYKGETTSEQILKDSEIIFDYLTTRVHVKSENILVFGRSIGSGPATHLAANRKIACLILMSAFTSLKAVAKYIIGVIPSLFIADRFNNVNKIGQVQSPVLLIHGRQDKLVPYSQSEELQSQIIKVNSKLYIQDDMTHNEFFLQKDIINPIISFMKKNYIEVVISPLFILQFPSDIFELPENFNKIQREKSLLRKIYEKVFENRFQ